MEVAGWSWTILKKVLMMEGRAASEFIALATPTRVYTGLSGSFKYFFIFNDDLYFRSLETTT